MTIMFLCFQSRVSDICSHLSSPEGRAIPPHHELDSRDNLKTSNVGSSLKKKKKIIAVIPVLRQLKVSPSQLQILRKMIIIKRDVEASGGRSCLLPVALFNMRVRRTSAGTCSNFHFIDMSGEKIGFALETLDPNLSLKGEIEILVLPGIEVNSCVIHCGGKIEAAE